jgi:hypothetical protein
MELGFDFGHHVQQDLSYWMSPSRDVLEAVAVAVALRAGGEQRAQHDAVVPARELGERVAVFGEGPARAVHHHHQRLRVPLVARVVRRVGAVRKARVAARSEDGAVAQVVDGFCAHLAEGDVNSWCFWRGEQSGHERTLNGGNGPDVQRRRPR